MAERDNFEWTKHLPTFHHFALQLCLRPTVPSSGIERAKGDICPRKSAIFIQDNDHLWLWSGNDEGGRAELRGHGILGLAGCRGPSETVESRRSIPAFDFQSGKLVRRPSHIIRSSSRNDVPPFHLDLSSILYPGNPDHLVLSFPEPESILIHGRSFFHLLLGD